MSKGRRQTQPTTQPAQQAQPTQPTQPTQKPAPELTLETLLNTGQPDEQARRVQDLIQLASTPDVFLCIHVDRSGGVSLKAMGMPLTSQDVHRVLDAARAEMIRLEVVAATASRQQQAGGQQVENQPGAQPEVAPASSGR